ncbi:MAG: protein-glutamate O-methyltransferase CheR [bacterium]
MDKNKLKNFDLSAFTQVPTGKIPPAEEFNAFKKNIAPLINLDLTNYKNTQMERRIVSLMNRCGMDNLNDYFNVLKTDSKKLEEFLNMLTINVTEFFRNPEKFQELETLYLPELLKNSRKLKVWSAGCSIGAEIYSLSMMFDKMKILNDCELIASDFDKTILEKAKNGIYSEMEVGSIGADYKKYFTSVGNDKQQVESRLRQKVKFEKRDLLNSKFEKDFDLILCRNVVIYFTDEAKDKLYKEFYDALKPGGVLFIGSTERINNHRAIGFNMKTPFFYQKEV